MLAGRRSPAASAEAGPSIAGAGDYEGEAAGSSTGEGELLELSLQDWGRRRAARPPAEDTCPGRGGSRSPDGQEAEPAATGEWACGACTLLNPGLAGRCEACGQRRRPHATTAVRRGQKKRPKVEGVTLDRFLAGKSQAASRGIDSPAPGGSADIAECSLCRSVSARRDGWGEQCVHDLPCPGAGAQKIYRCSFLAVQKLQGMWWRDAFLPRPGDPGDWSFLLHTSSMRPMLTRREWLPDTQLAQHMRGHRLSHR